MTVTVELHEAVAPRESVALHVNEVVPTGNSDPDAGAQLVVYGLTPPLTVGVNETLTGLPVDDVEVGAGHTIESGVVPITPDATSFDGVLSVPEAL